MEKEIDALELLKRDHRDMELLLARLEREGPDSGIVDELRALLDVHARLEEELFYPEVRSRTRSRVLIDGALDDHHHMHELLEQRRLGELGVAIAAHIADEESHIFTAAERALGRGRLVELGRAMTRRLGELEGQATRATRQP
jgi:hypothetical protein